jgi:hypothetical protein
LADVDRVLVVVAAGAEGILGEGGTSEVISRRRGSDVDDVVLASQLLQGGRCAGAHCADQDVNPFNFDQFPADTVRDLWIALVVAHEDLDLALI